MNRLKLIPFIGLFFILPSGLVFADQFFHDEPAPVLLGETMRLELTNTESNQPVSDVFVFYRMHSDPNFRSMRMEQEGFVYNAEINSSKMLPGNMEYYFAYQDPYGNAKYLPPDNPENNPFTLKILPAQKDELVSGKKLFIPLLLNPAPKAVVNPDELFIAFSIPFEIEHPENLEYKMLISGVDVSKKLIRDGNLLSYIPKTIRSGLQNVEFKVLNQDGKIVGQNQFSFRISGEPSKQKAFESSTNVFINDRYQNISETSENYYRAGLRFRGSYKKFDFLAHGLISSEESFNRQPVNQFSASVSYTFNERNNIYLKGGDFTTSYDPLSFWNKRIRGIGAGFHTTWFDFDYTQGQNYRAVEGKADTSGTTQYGTYKQNFMSFQPQFNITKHFSWALDLVNAKDDPKSIKYGTNPKEALVVGTSMDINMDKKRIQLKGSIQASIKNEDASSEIDIDSLQNALDMSDSDYEQAEPFAKFLDKSGFLTISSGLAPLPSLAMQFETQVRYFGNSFKATYKRIDAEFTSPGNPYLQKDIIGLFISDNIRLLSNQVMLNIYFNTFEENLSENEYKVNNQAFGGSISYFPLTNLPSITLSYGNQTRKNDADSLFAEDNQNQRFGISSSYKLKTGAIRNTITFSTSKSLRSDKVNAQNESDFLLLSFGVRNQFDFPLTTRFNYSQYGTSLYFSQFNSDANNWTYTQNQMDVQKFQLGVDYIFKQFYQKSDLKPFLNISIQNITNSTDFSEDYSRKNYDAGVYLKNTGFGAISLRYSFIDYGKLYDWSDKVFSGRYEVTF